MPVVFDVVSEADLNAVLAQIDVSGGTPAPATAYTISLGASFALTGDLAAINLDADSSLTIQGNGHTVDGGGLYHGLVVYAGTVAINDLAIDHAAAIGGPAGIGGSDTLTQYGGGGAGAGLGGGLFVASAGVVTLSNVTFSGDSATGGSVLNSPDGILGGGGLDGGVGGRGGGGFGLSASGDVPGAGIILGAAPGGSSFLSSQGQFGTYSGGAYGGGGAGGDAGAGGGVGGGVAGYVGSSGISGGAGGFGGGGGVGGSYYDAARKVHVDAGGAGGFGGGGGGGSTDAGIGGNGGFGGGGGGGTGFTSALGQNGTSGGAGGFGAGVGGVAHVVTAAGGGGLGAGGAIFVEQGGSLVIAGGAISDGSVAGGTGLSETDNITASGNGSGFGSGLFLQGNGHITLAAAFGTTLTISDVIADQTGSTHQSGLSAAGDPLAGAGSLLVAGDGIVLLSAANTYSGGTTLAAGTLELADPAAAGSGDISFTGLATLALDGTTPPANHIAGFVAGDAVDLRGLAYSPDDTLSVSGSMVTIQAGGLGYTLDIAAPSSAFGLFAAADGSVVLSAACYAAGTCIATPDGDRRVEDLRAGDLVHLARGGTAPVRWVGHRRVDLRRHSDPAALRPVRVRADSFGPGLPVRDLLLSPEHALFLDNVLIPVRALIDGDRVVQESWDRITYHHIELDRHEVILAEGLPAETYLDTGNRADFANGVLATLHPCFAPGVATAEACAPLHLDGPIIAAVRARLRTTSSRAA